MTTATKEHLSHIAFPLGGIGAGMISLEGTGALAQVSLRHKPDVHHEPQACAALHVQGAKTARVLEGPVPMRKAFGSVVPSGLFEAGNGLTGRTYGLPRLLVIAGMRQGNANFMKAGDQGASVGTMDRGFGLRQDETGSGHAAAGGFAAFTDDPATKVDAAWFRGGWWDAFTMVWNHVAAGDCVANPPHAEGAPGSGGSLYVPFKLKPKAEKIIRLQFAWHVPKSGTHAGGLIPPGPEPFLCDGWQVSRLMPAKDIRRAPYVGLKKDAGWEFLPVNQDFLNVHPIRGENGLVYFSRKIQIAAAGKRVLHFGHDGGVRIFVDGKARAPSSLNAGCKKRATQPSAKRSNPCSMSKKSSLSAAV